MSLQLSSTPLPLFVALGLVSSIASAQISFAPATTQGLQNLRPDWVAAGDWDEDGDTDLAVSTGTLSGGAGPDFVEIYSNDGAGNFTLAQAINLGFNVSTAALVAGDYDLDGDLDIAVSLKDINQVRTLVNAGGFFTAAGTVSVSGSEPRHMASADVNADGFLDLVTSNRNGNSLSVLLGTGAGTFTPGATIAGVAEPRHLALDDLNGDCRIDIAVAAHDSRLVQVFFGTGGGAFGAPTSYALPGNNRPNGIVACDFDDDGDVDLATTTDQNDIGWVIVMTNQGTGTFASAIALTNGVNPDAIVAIDLDADGDPDLATADEDANHVSALVNNGGFFSPGVTFATGAAPTSIVAADLNGDGSADLVTANRDSNSMSILRNNAQGGTETYCIGRANSAGAGARIDSSGSLSIAANNFTLKVRCGAAGQPGLFFYGRGRNGVPFGNGRLCVQGPLHRLSPPVVMNGAGSVSRALDFTSSPASGGAGLILAGVKHDFQLWYRDPVAGGAAFNTTDALEATFRP